MQVQVCLSAMCWKSFSETEEPLFEKTNNPKRDFPESFYQDSEEFSSSRMRLAIFLDVASA